MSSKLASRAALRVQPYRGARLELARHRDAPDPGDLQQVRRWVRSACGPTAIDMFCGAGGLSLGLRDAGFAVLVGADHDRHAIETHVANLGGLGYVGDLSEPRRFLNQLNMWGISRVDLIAGGVPCQPFSRAGRPKIRSLVRTGLRSADDSRADLWRSFVRVVRVLKPRAVLLENVPDLAMWDEGAVLVDLCESLRRVGYRLEVDVLNASQYGVPQHRARLFLVGIQDGVDFSWPQPVRRSTSVRIALNDLPAVPAAQRRDGVSYKRPRSWLQRWFRKGVPRADRHRVYDHITRALRPDDAKAFRLLGQGGTYKDLPKRLQRYRSDIFDDKYKRLSWNDLSRSITAHIAKDGYWYIHPAQDRTLSIREAARIQTFPDWFRFAGRPTQRYAQIGNAVPPLLARAIGIQLRAALEARRSPLKADIRQTFRKDLLSWHSLRGHDFPWRAGTRPWHVLVAETCLRRTRTRDLATAYRAICRIAPTPRAMVANARHVRKLARSFGLSKPVSEVIVTARYLLKSHKGKMPASKEALKSLPCVSEHVASTVLSFGFGHRAAVMDASTVRIVSRVSGRMKPTAWQLRLDLYRLSGPEGTNAAFNSALLDLAALCKATGPLCADCPVRWHCNFYRSHRNRPT